MYAASIISVLLLPPHLLPSPNSPLTAMHSRSQCGASINYTPMSGRVCYRRLEKSSALERHSSEFQYGRRSDRRDACLPISRRVIGSTDICLFYEIGDARERRTRVYCLNIRYNVTMSRASFIRPPIAEIAGCHERLRIDRWTLTSTSFTVAFNISVAQDANEAFIDIECEDARASACSHVSQSCNYNDRKGNIATVFPRLELFRVIVTLKLRFNKAIVIYMY